MKKRWFTEMKTNAKFKKMVGNTFKQKEDLLRLILDWIKFHESMMMRARALMQAELRGGRQSNYLIFSTLET